MVEGRYSDSNLGELTRRVLETRQYGMADFAPYEPSGGVPASFIAVPLIDDEHDQLEYIIALQLSLWNPSTPLCSSGKGWARRGNPTWWARII